MLISYSSFFAILIVSVALGCMTSFIWDITPAKWLCDYGEAPCKKHQPQTRSLESYTVFFQVVFFLYILQGVLLGFPLSKLLLHVILLFAFLQLSISDIKFLILQDQWIFLIAILALMIPGKFQTKLQGFLLPIFIYYMLALSQKLWSIQAPFGMGDAKLMAALGFCFGPTSLFFISCYAFLLSGTWAALLLLQKKATKKDRVYLGPFLCIACLYFMVSTIFI